MPNDVADWLTMNFNNPLVLIGQGNFTTGSPAPSSFVFSFTPSITNNTLFDSFFLLITNPTGSLVTQTSGSKIDLYLLSSLQDTYKIRYISNQGRYFEFDLDDTLPLLFDSCTATLFASFTATTTYSYTVYAVKLSQEVQAFNKQLLVIETDGTITSANVWQNIYQFVAKPDYILFQNQGNGYMHISIGPNVTPTVTGLRILQGESFLSDSDNIPMNNSTGNYLWLKGTVAGDPWILWAP